ncbi:unknown [Firmicutes bacterium CAG:631]|nr:unknown [Firmicutes bacterium CAG:631]
MILIKKVWIKIYKFLAKTGFVFLQLSGMIIVAFFLVSLKLVKEEVKNPYCRIENQNVKLELNYDSIDYYTYEIHCNTLNTEIYLMDSIGKNQAISLLIEIKQQLENEQIQILTHFTIYGAQLENVIYANLNLGYEGISYIGG